MPITGSPLIAFCCTASGEGGGWLPPGAPALADRRCAAEGQQIPVVAMMEGALAETVAYVKGRAAFGASLFDLQNTRFRLAEAQATAHVARVFLDHCIVNVAAGKLDSASAAMCKYWTSERLQQVLDTCLQMHGGYGYMDEYLICRMYADARVARIYAGTSEIMLEVIARSL
ncbi:MAG: hypothetical protein IPH23_08370 [Gammaproteobacteria bacterium]|nr:hypothetical protein [Gammaproteobacteria bacterium]